MRRASPKRRRTSAGRRDRRVACRRRDARLRSETAVSELDRVFAGSIPALYEQYLGPLIFQPYAVDIAERVAHAKANRVLETAAGTGILTRALCRRLPDTTAIVATDLN